MHHVVEVHSSWDASEVYRLNTCRDSNLYNPAGRSTECSEFAIALLKLLACKHTTCNVSAVSSEL